MSDFERKVTKTLQQFGLSPDFIKARRLPMFPDAEELTIAHTSQSGINHLLSPAAARAWQMMRDNACRDSVELVMISGFRSFDKQRELIEKRLLNDESVEAVLRVIAPPGCSEHHSGRAADIGTPGCPPLSEDFERTDAFRWLAENAHRFGFLLSYPRNNIYGFTYEPWHWCMVEIG